MQCKILFLAIENVGLSCAAREFLHAQRKEVRMIDEMKIVLRFSLQTVSDRVSSIRV